jgi:hypothetical protein
MEHVPLPAAALLYPGAHASHDPVTFKKVPEPHCQEVDVHTAFEGQVVHATLPIVGLYDAPEQVEQGDPENPASQKQPAVELTPFVNVTLLAPHVRGTTDGNSQ